MKKIIILLLILLIQQTAFADFQGTLTKTALDFVAKPNDFFIELNTDIENTGPSTFSDKLQIQTSLLWDLMTMVNIQAKYNVYQGNKYIPEITPGVSYWNFLGTSLLPKEDISASIQGYTPFITIATKVENDLKLFSGVKYTVGQINIKLKSLDDPKMSDSFSISLDSLTTIESVYQEVGLYAGLNYLRVSGREVMAIVGYYPSLKKMYSKIQITGHTFDHGISFYPDSFLLMHYYWNIHFGF